MRYRSQTVRSCQPIPSSKSHTAVNAIGSTSSSSHSDRASGTFQIRACRNLSPLQFHNRTSQRDRSPNPLIGMIMTARREEPAMEIGPKMECTRCQGTTVQEVFVDWASGGGHLSFPGRRCLLCGDITDSLILVHRTERPRQHIRTTRHPRVQAFTSASIGTGRASLSSENNPQ